MSESKKARGRPAGPSNRTEALGPFVKAFRDSGWNDAWIAYIVGAAGSPNVTVGDRLKQKLDRLEASFKAGRRDSKSRARLARAKKELALVGDPDPASDDPQVLTAIIEFLEACLQVTRAEGNGGLVIVPERLPRGVCGDPERHLQGLIGRVRGRLAEAQARTEQARVAEELEAMKGHPFLVDRGIDPAIWSERGCRRYQRGDERVVEEYRPYLKPTKLQTPRRAVNQCTCKHRKEPGFVCPGTCGGWFMPKHPPKGFEPIPPQLRPDEPVIVNPTWKVHYHGSGEEAVWPTDAPDEYFRWLGGGDLEKGRKKYRDERAGKPFPRWLKRTWPTGKETWHRNRRRWLEDDAAEAHIAKGRDDQERYDPATGLGEHWGENLEEVHFHAPSECKYAMFGTKEDGDPYDSSRIDLHPAAARLLPTATRVFFVLEGCPKNDSVLSTGEAVFSVPSVTCWTASELKRFAKVYLRDKHVFVVPDNDWETNEQVAYKAIQARTVLRSTGIDAYCCAPPYVKDGPKVGVDDYLGDHYTVDDLVIGGPEPPEDEIKAAVAGVTNCHTRKRLEGTLRNMSLYSDEDGRLVGWGRRNRGRPFSLDRIRNQLAIRGATLDGEWVPGWRRVIPTLEALSHTFTVEGSLEITVKEVRIRDPRTGGYVKDPDTGRYKTVERATWKEPPIITLKEKYRADRPIRKTLRDAGHESVALELIRTGAEIARAGTEILRRDAEERLWLAEHERREHPGRAA